MSGAKSHYEILGLKQSATLVSEDVKAAYHIALLAHHPDRLKAAAATHATPDPTVDEIVSAYKVLSDDKRRAEYDRASSQSRVAQTDGNGLHFDHSGIVTYDLEDLTYHPKTGIWSRDCRCGDEKGYVVTEAELEEVDQRQGEEHGAQREVSVGCHGCSLRIRVTFAVEPS